MSRPKLKQVRMQLPLASLGVAKPMVDTGPERKPWQGTNRLGTRLSGRPLQRRNMQVKIRDKFSCQRCGRVTYELEVDHIIPVAAGGTEEHSNLQCLCHECHHAKTIEDRKRWPSAY